ncbi:MAG: FAD-binding protein [Actinomycetota bacterium]|nr:FAD-binding protein [Actinomycetota bacterium]
MPAVEYPATEAELRAIVKQASRGGRRLKVVGRGPDRNETGDVVISMGNYGRVMRIDSDAGSATVQAGIGLGRLNLALAARGLSLEHPGGLPDATLGGAVSTGDHGSGGRSPSLAAQVLGLELIVADGSTLSCSTDHEPEIFDAARVSLGALGVISTVTVRCVPGFNLRSETRRLPLHDLLADFDRWVDGHDHFRCTWLAGTSWATATWGDHTAEPTGPSVNRGYRVLCRARRGAAREVEYSLPRLAGLAALRQMGERGAGGGRRLPFPIRVGVGAADDIPLSPASGRPSVYLAVPAGHGRLEAMLDGLGGRPHWRTAGPDNPAALRARYPRWDAWQAVRADLDPGGLFANRVEGQTSGQG